MSTELKKISTQLAAMKPQMELALPKHLSVDRMTRLALTQFSTNRKLFECSWQSVAGAIMTAVQMGLEPGVAGQGYLIPYRGVCQFVPGWKGIMDIANRAGKCTTWTGAVFEGDIFSWGLGDSPFIKHIPCGEDDPSKLTHAYAVGRIKEQDWPVIECWTAARLKRHRDHINKVGEKHYSFQHWEMYCRKVVLLQVLKYMPGSIELMTAVEYADRQEFSNTAKIVDGIVISEDVSDDSQSQTQEEKKPSRMDAVKQQMKSNGKDNSHDHLTATKKRFDKCHNTSDCDELEAELLNDPEADPTMIRSVKKERVAQLA